MSAQLIFISDDDEPTTYFIDRLPQINERDARICRALMDMFIDHMDNPRPIMSSWETPA